MVNLYNYLLLTAKLMKIAEIANPAYKKPYPAHNMKPMFYQIRSLTTDSR